MGTIITAATIITMYLNSLSNLNSQNYYNADMKDGKLTTMYVFAEHGKSLSPKLEYRYSYDMLDRVVSKEAYRYNPVTGKAEPSYRLDFAYNADGYSVEHSRWNAGKKAYDRADCRTDYRRENGTLVSVHNYEWSDKHNGMMPVNNMLVMGTADDMLFAGR